MMKLESEQARLISGGLSWYYVTGLATTFTIRLCHMFDRYSKINIVLIQTCVYIHLDLFLIIKV